MRQRWFSKRAIVLHVLVVVLAPACLVAGWWQVTRALSGNLLSYFYSLEWPLFAVLGVVGWWQLVHDIPVVGERPKATRTRASWLHRDDELSTRPLRWDKAQESPELAAYNEYLKALSAGRARKTWANPRGLPVVGEE